MRGLYWVRTDLRMHDNLALSRFCLECDEGILLWCPTQSYLKSETYRKNFINDCLFSFSKQISKFDQVLIQAHNPIEHELVSYIREQRIDKVYYTNECAFDEICDEGKVQDLCRQNKIKSEGFDQATLVSRSNLPFDIENMPFVFTDFRKKVEASLKISPPIEAPKSLPRKVRDLGESLSEQIQDNLLFSGGEEAALARVHNYLFETKAIESYKETRNGMIEWNDSAKLSPWFAHGCLSPRYVYSELKRYEHEVNANESTYWLLFELLWRDYLKFFSMKYQRQIFQESGVRPRREYSPVLDHEIFERWSKGQTTDEFINANVNELNRTGWMSNRGRQNVASYFIHQLKLPWTWGAAYFEKLLIDYDPDLNWGNWLYLSGNGSDPRARVFNTLRQAEQYDPSGEYRKKWLS